MGVLLRPPACARWGSLLTCCPPALHWGRAARLPPGLPAGGLAGWLRAPRSLLGWLSDGDRGWCRLPRPAAPPGCCRPLTSSTLLSTCPRCSCLQRKRRRSRRRRAMRMCRKSLSWRRRRRRRRRPPRVRPLRPLPPSRPHVMIPARPAACSAPPPAAAVAHCCCCCCCKCCAAPALPALRAPPCRCRPLRLPAHCWPATEGEEGEEEAGEEGAPWAGCCMHAHA